MHFASAARTLKFGERQLRTPLLVPAFSSRAPLKKVGAPLSQEAINTYLEQMGEDVVGPALISAFDLHHENIPIPKPEAPKFGAAPTFLDSGGYENLTLAEESTDKVTEEHYFAVLKSWPEQLPIIAVNSDCEDADLGKQVQSALSLPVSPASGKLLLLKPEKNDADDDLSVDLSPIIAQIPDHVASLKKLSAIGLTEKEAGASFVQRVAQIRSLRQVLNACELSEMPIHVFGGLDPLRTYYYFLAGADIFDGTSWLRFAFQNSEAVYLDAFASVNYPDENIEWAEWEIRRQNLRNIAQMQIAMRTFLTTNQVAELDIDYRLVRSLFSEDG